MKICVIGLGYIGLPTSAMFASHGCQVVGVDVSENVVKTLNEGKIHIEEPGLEELIKNVVNTGKFRASLSPESADAFIISVPTPNLSDEFLSCDLTYVMQALRTIMPYLKHGNTIIIESTIAPKSMDDVIKPLVEESGLKIGQDIYLAHCPERVLPGKILYELKYNNRIVGGITLECTNHAAEIYSVFVEGEIIKTEAKTAELSKCMENTFRDVNIALANELAKICYKLDINCLDVIEMANKHPRVNIHQPGPGVGGHCLAIDPYFICSKAPEEARIIKLSRDMNKSMPEFVVEKIEMLLSKVKDPKITVFGVTYKGNVDDIRESPAMEVVKLLQTKKYERIDIYDPHVNNPAYKSFEESIENSDLIVILTDHNEYKNLDFNIIVDKMRNPIIFDTKNIINNEDKKVTIVNYGNLYKFKNEFGRE